MPIFFLNCFLVGHLYIMKFTDLQSVIKSLSTKFLSHEVILQKFITKGNFDLCLSKDYFIMQLKVNNKNLKVFLVWFLNVITVSVYFELLQQYTRIWMFSCIGKDLIFLLSIVRFIFNSKIQEGWPEKLTIKIL